MGLRVLNIPKTATYAFVPWKKLDKIPQIQNPVMENFDIKPNLIDRAKKVYIKRKITKSSSIMETIRPISIPLYINAKYSLIVHKRSVQKNRDSICLFVIVIATMILGI